jgi:predicted HD phosphohydrolase
VSSEPLRFYGPQATTLDDVVDLLYRAASFTAGEEVSVLDHGLQTADLLRRAFPRDVALQVAGLLHDIDHVLGCHPSVHGELAAHYLDNVMSPEVVGLIRLHVPAKRYLVATDPDYRARLSAASELSLRAQGADLLDDELDELVLNPMWRRVVALRRADEQAKTHGVRFAPLSSWLAPLEQMVRRVVTGHAVAS